MADSSRCRLCFSADNLVCDAIFPSADDGQPPNQSLITMIQECTSIRISLERDFPSCPICGTCLQMLKQFHSYRQRCLANDRQLRRHRGLEGDAGDDVDPLEEGFPAVVVKREPDDDGQFYRQMRQQIREFLQTKIREIERMALEEVSETLRSRGGGIGLEMAAEEQDKTDWKSKYLTLQKNNELLQQAFREQKIKLKQTEQMLRTYQQQSSHFETMNFLEERQPAALGFTTHSAIPEITPEYLHDLNLKAGAGQKGDRYFISSLAVAVFGEEVLANSSVTGRVSNSHNNIPPKPPLCRMRLSAISAKLYERVEQELGMDQSNREELLQRSSVKVVRAVVCQKLTNLRKVIKKSQPEGSGGEEEFEEPTGKRTRC